MADKMSNIYQAMGAVQAGSPQYVWKKYERTAEGKSVTSPAGGRYVASTRELQGEVFTYEGKRYKNNFLLLDDNMNIWANVQEVVEPGKKGAGAGLGTDKEGKLKKTEGAAGQKQPERLIRFDASFIELGSTPAMQDEYNKIMVPLEGYRRDIQSRAQKPAEIITNFQNLKQQKKTTQETDLNTVDFNRLKQQ
jgi:hypothetical protein